MSALPLAPYRALDLTNETGHLCGRILADLGAEVIKVEPRGGDPARYLGPFYQDQPHPERSLSWWAYNYNKRSVTLNLESAAGQALFRRLVGTADFVIETAPPGALDRLGIGYAAITEGGAPDAGRPLVWVAITPFGQTGPRANWRATDLIAMATGGWCYVTGDADRPPVRVSVPQAYPQAGAQAAVGALIAHLDRVRTGRGHFVDVSMQEAVTDSLLDVQPYWDLSGFIHQRGDRIAYGAVVVRSVWPCADGYVAWRVYVGRGPGDKMRAMVDWLRDEGLGEHLAGVAWESFDTLRLRQEAVDAWESALAPFFLRHTKQELYAGALARGIMLFPVNDPRDIVASEQLAARDFFVPVEHAELGATLRYPGTCMQTQPVPLAIRRRPPRIGEDNAAVYGALGVPAEQLRRWQEEGVV